MEVLEAYKKLKAKSVGGWGKRKLGAFIVDFAYSCPGNVGKNMSFPTHSRKC